MIRTQEATGKTVDEARAKACALLGVQAEDLNVSYEVLEMPQKTGFLGLKLTPAKVRVSVEEPDVPAAPIVEEAPAPAAEEKVEAPAEEAAAPAPAEDAPAAEQPAAPVEEAAAPAEETAAPAEEAEEVEVPINIEENNKVKAAVDYLKEVITLMGVSDVTFSAVQKGEATIIRLDGEKLGALIGRRGETMESLSYLASLVINRMEGPYVKLGLDVGGYRNKREDDLSALAKRIADRVIRTGCYYEMEPMNPYERHIIHTAIADIEGVRSESKGEGPTRHIVIYSTDPNASNLPDRDNARNTRGPRRDGGRGPRRDGRGPRRDGGRGPRSGGPHRDGRGPRRDGGRPYGGPRSSVPGREFADRPRDPNAQPMAPKTTERIHDGDDFAFGKIEF